MKMKIRISFWLGISRFRKEKDLNVMERLQQKIWDIPFLEALRKERQEQELFTSCMILKNLAIVQKGMPVSTDYLLEELASASSVLRRVYMEILFRWRAGQGDRSFDPLTEQVHSIHARNFAYILAGTDQINPGELVSAMESFEEALASERMTRALNSSTRRSMITTAMAAAAVFAVLMNFTVVVVFMDMMRMLGGLSSLN